MLDESILRELRADLSHCRAAIRAESVDALAVVRDVPGLQRALISSDAYVRARALRALGTAHGRVTWRLARLSRDIDPRVRATLAEVSSHGTGWCALRALRRLVRDAAPQVRYQAVLGLAARADGAAQRVLRAAATREQEPGLREAIAALLRPVETRRNTPRPRVPAVEL